jgi:GTP pyrophosphokinase
MVKVKEKFPRLDDGRIDLQQWLATHFSNYSQASFDIIATASEYAQICSVDNATFYGQSCFEQALECAEILAQLHADNTTIAAGIVFCSMQGIDITLEDVQEHLDNEVCLLIKGMNKMSAIRLLHQQTNKGSNAQVDNLRKMLLAMVSDIRVVLITLAQRLCIMRGIQVLGHDERRDYAEETEDIYAPLANRLGISDIKWELEDLSFHDSNPSTYQLLAKALNEKRRDRQVRVDNIIELLTNKLTALNIKVQVTGRAKHIFSIYKKMQRKEVGFDEVYDTHAVRIIVDTKEQCYQALSLVHDLWPPIKEEFDDYISSPKPNGYQSIHTAVTDKDNKYLEIQIRTEKMHQESELGVAAHWMYKEGVKGKGGYESKISWLRELLDWHKELSHNDEALDRFHDQVFEERVYVFTPNGDIFDLSENATPIDFAYHIHSEVGHRCKGARVNGKMVQLTYKLLTGDNVEIIRSKEPRPSRDWLNPSLGYLATSKARTKVHHWFKQEHVEKNISEGKIIFDKECQRLNASDISVEKIANDLNARNSKELFINLTCGQIKPTQIHHAIHRLYPQVKLPEKQKKIHIKPKLTANPNRSSIYVQGVSNLLSHTAKCCQPVPGEEIIGYITQGKGVSVHRKDCHNISDLSQRGQARLLDAQWTSNDGQHPIQLKIECKELKPTLDRLTQLLTQEKIAAQHIEEVSQTKQQYFMLIADIIVSDITVLNQLIDKINQFPGVVTINRR